nr:reverse transcriptase domain-containing protein [Tanacetum cinerariifolium]
MMNPCGLLTVLSLRLSISAITISETANEFAIKGNHLTPVKGNQFDGRTKTDPHKHIYKFLKIYDMFKYRDIENKAVCLMMFPLSLTREAKTWLDELNEGTIETWDELRTTFISRFFPPDLFDRLLREIQAFSQHENESLADAWLRMKEMLRNCHGHNLSEADGIFLYKTPNQAYQLLKDKVLLKLDWAKNQKTKSSLKKTIVFADKGSSNSNTDKIMARMDAKTIKMDAQYKELQTHAKKRNPILMKMTYLCLVKKRLISCKLFKQLNLGVGTERMIFNIDSAMKHSYSNDDTYFSIDVINEILEEGFDALLEEGCKILHSIEGTLLVEKIFAEFDEFMAMTADKKL